MNGSAILNRASHILSWIHCKWKGWHEALLVQPNDNRRLFDSTFSHIDSRLGFAQSFIERLLGYCFHSWCVFCSIWRHFGAHFNLIYLATRMQLSGSHHKSLWVVLRARLKRQVSATCHLISPAFFFFAPSFSLALTLRWDKIGFRYDVCRLLELVAHVCHKSTHTHTDSKWI